MIFFHERKEFHGIRLVQYNLNKSAYTLITWNMVKEKTSWATYGGENKSNRRRPFYKKKSGNFENNVVKHKVKELKFYLYDSAARKKSESFGRIKEAII